MSKLVQQLNAEICVQGGGGESDFSRFVAYVLYEWPLRNVPCCAVNVNVV